MKTMLISYQVKPDRVDENKRYVQNVFKELQALAPTDFKYASMLQEDGVSFVHMVSFDPDDGNGPLPELAAFKQFIDNIAERCDIPPNARVVEVVGDYRVFGAN